MARKHRSFVSGFPVHVVQRGNNKNKIFFDDSDRLQYLDYLIAATDRHDCPVHCYALMNNHIHLLVTPSTDAALPKAMQSLNTRYVMHINRVWERTGTIWDGRYKTSLVDSDEYLTRVYQYIELNPVKDGYCKHPQDYIWSSHRFHALGELDRVVTAHRLYTLLGDTAPERQARYRRLFSGV